jgi:hypothetical protein
VQETKKPRNQETMSLMYSSRNPAGRQAIVIAINELLDFLPDDIAIHLEVSLGSLYHAISNGITKENIAEFDELLEAMTPLDPRLED